MSHYFDPRSKPTGSRYVIADVINGVPLTLMSSDGVFSKRRIDDGTRVLLENATLPERGHFLDLGCGIGAIGIYAALARPNALVFMVDINPVAVKLAKRNALLNRVSERVRVMKGDLFTPLKGFRFDLILSNPPLAKGKETLGRILRGGREFLREGGEIYLVLSKGEEWVLKEMNSTYAEVEVVKRIKGYTVIRGKI
jgi:16S rRNA G1207 methylase RsmC